MTALVAAPRHWCVPCGREHQERTRAVICSECLKDTWLAPHGKCPPCAPPAYPVGTRVLVTEAVETSTHAVRLPGFVGLPGRVVEVVDYRERGVDRRSLIDGLRDDEPAVLYAVDVAGHPLVLTQAEMVAAIEPSVETVSVAGGAL